MSGCVRRLRIRRASLLVTLLVALSAVAAQAESLASPLPAQSIQLAPPPNQAARGLIYGGLTRNRAGPCSSLFQITGTDLCTHGPDPLAPGITLASTPPLIASGKTPPRPASACVGDGTRGRRIQVLYVRAEDTPDQFDTVRSTIQLLAEGVDTIYAASAAETQGLRQIRYVTEPLGDSCAIRVLPVVLSASGDDTFGATVSELRSLGYSRTDRKYLIFMDARIVCGIGTLVPTDEPALTNPNNLGPSFARVDVPCWTARAAAHEVAHNLGAVQDSAPYSTGSGHCVDEYDSL